MRWTVVYSSSAQKDLAEIWLNAPNQGAIADAADHIDRWLAIDPLNAGESRSGRKRIVVSGPLVVQFEVSVDDRLVIVVSVRYFRRRND